MGTAFMRMGPMRIDKAKPLGGMPAQMRMGAVKIEEVKIPEAAKKALKKEGIETKEQAKEKGAKALSEIKGVGAKSIEEILS